MKTKYFDDKEAPLYLAIKRRYYDGREMLYHLKRKARFSYNYLADYSQISQTDEDDNLRTYYFSDLMYKSTHRFGTSFAQPFSVEESQSYSPAIQQMTSRIEESSQAESGMQFYDINVPIARRIVNTLLTASVQNQFAAKYVGFNSDMRTLMFSNSLNFHIQRMLKKGQYFDKVYPILKFMDIVEGTTYLRIDYEKKYTDTGMLKDEIKFTPIPVYEILDDGRYTTDSYDELSNSKFVIQLHTLDKESLIKLLNRFKKNVEKDVNFDTNVRMSGGVFPYDSNNGFSSDVEDINALWDKYAIQNYRSVAVLEVFWKDYESLQSENFTWRRTFFIASGGELVELLTVKSDYVYGLPIIRKKHQIQPNSIFGYTSTPNNINTDLARNTILNGKLHEARRNSYQKLFMSSYLANMKDDQNRYWTPYQDQVFNRVPLKFSSGQSIKNLMGSFDAPQMDTQPLLMIDKITNEVKEDFVNPVINPNRTSSSTLSEFYRQQDQKYQPMFLAEKMFNKEVVQVLYSILKNAYSEEDFKQINEINKSYSDGLDLYSFDLKSAPNNIVDMGVEIVMKNEEESIKNQQQETLLPLITQLGPQILEDENLISFLGLREKGYFLPKDKEKLTYLRDIFSIINGKIKMQDVIETEERPSKIVLYRQNVDDATGVQTRVYDMQNHKIAVELTKEYIVKNRYEFMTLDDEIRATLYTYLDEHTKAMEMQMKSAQAQIQQIQQAQNPPQEAQQELPPELAQMQQ